MKLLEDSTDIAKDRWRFVFVADQASLALLTQSAVKSVKKHQSTAYALNIRAVYVYKYLPRSSHLKT